MNPSLSGIILSPSHWAQILDDVKSRLSEEACGFVLGEQNQARLIIPIQNVLHDPYRFRMDPQEELDAFLLAEKEQWDIIAIYHSHPHGISQPSATDIAELTFPGIVYLILFQINNHWQCRAFLMESGSSVSEVSLIISSDA
jgi:proteasome lid subunit RPN8/RPN11